MSEESAAPSAAPSGRLTVQAVLKTDVGLVRSENQDFGTYTTPEEERHAHPGGRLLLVADGMGGHRGGATASRLAAETIKNQYLGSETDDPETALRESLSRANARIFSEAQANPDLRGMGTTTSALVVRDDMAWFGHVGDSRIYLVRNEEIRQLTEDHSLVASMVREGLITSKEAEVHPRRNVLQRSMGVGEDVEIDIRGPFPVQEGDVFILCSDGLHGLVKEDELKDIARLPLRAAADEYVRRALQRGAPDNVTVIVAKIVDIDKVGEETLVDDDALLDETQPVDTLNDVTLRDAEMDEHVTMMDTPLPTLVQPPPPPPPPPPAEPFPDTVKVRALTLPEPEPESKLPDTEKVPIAILQQAVAAADGEPQAQAGKPALHRGGVLWTIVVVLAVVAAGAWYFWSHSH
jgi:protein phosphatase